MILATHGILKGGGISGDPDALAYFTALNITTDLTLTDGSTLTPTEVFNAINTFFLAIKGGGYYSKFLVIRPCIGGTATRHAYNAVNPVANDAAFYAQYANSPTHDAWGVTHNGSSTNEDSKVVASTRLTNNNFSIGYYQTNDFQSTGIAFGVGVGGVGTDRISMYPWYIGNMCYIQAGSSTEFGFATTSSKFFHQLSSYNNGTNDRIRAMQNGVSKVDANDTKTALRNQTITFGVMQNSGYYPARYGYNYICDEALTAAEELHHYNTVNALQTTFKRNNT